MMAGSSKGHQQDLLHFSNFFGAPNLLMKRNIQEKDQEMNLRDACLERIYS